ncbi:MAG: T9SS type A sorting domain-containing protein [Bacteroidota bacterium]
MEFSVYPNPASESLTILLPNESMAQIEVMDLTGRILEEIDVTDQRQLDVSGFPEGIYLITVTSELVYLTKKIVVKR